MPLRDHFHPTLSLQRHWHSLSQRLGFSDCGGFKHKTAGRTLRGAKDSNSTSRLISQCSMSFEPIGGVDRTGALPSPTRSVVLTVLTDLVEVQVYNGEAGPVLVGANELVNPSNKDRPAHRDAFITKSQGSRSRARTTCIVGS